MRVDPDISGLNLSGEVVCTVDVGRPDRCAETVESVVGLLYGFFVGAEAK